MQESYKYEINSKTYTQGPIVLGQLSQLLEIITGVALPETIDIQGVVASLGDKIPRVLAIVLCEKGVQLKNKNIEGLTEELSDHATLDMAREIIADFFDCNQVASLWKEIEGLVPQMTAEAVLTGSDKSSCCSQKETSPDETTSSGDTPSESASHT